MIRTFTNCSPDDAAVDRFQVAARSISPKPLTRDQAREGLGNLLDFLILLERWDAGEREPAIPDHSEENRCTR